MEKNFTKQVYSHQKRLFADKVQELKCFYTWASFFICSYFQFLSNWQSIDPCFQDGIFALHFPKNILWCSGMQVYDQLGHALFMHVHKLGFLANRKNFKEEKIQAKNSRFCKIVKKISNYFMKKSISKWGETQKCNGYNVAENLNINLTDCKTTS